jgi:hypothetical protein
MSPVGKLAVAPGTIALSAQVRPPSFETKTGAKGPPVGLGVKAVATICSGLFGFTARLGSLSWFVSPLTDFGIMLTTVIFMAVPYLAV